MGVKQVKEVNLVPKVHRGMAYSLSYNYYLQEERSFRVLEIEAAYAGLHSRYEKPAASQYLQLKASYSFLFSLYHNEYFSFYAGPQAGFGYGLGFYPNWDDSHLYWADYIGAGGAGLITYRREKGIWLLKTTLPVFSMISRPEKSRQYKIDDISAGGIIKNMNSHWEPAFPDRNFASGTGLEYLHPSGNKLSLSIGYSFHYLYMKADKGSPFLSVDNSLTFKLFF